MGLITSNCGFAGIDLDGNLLRYPSVCMVMLEVGGPGVTVRVQLLRARHTHCASLQR